MDLGLIVVHNNFLMAQIACVMCIVLLYCMLKLLPSKKFNWYNIWNTIICVLRKYYYDVCKNCKNTFFLKHLVLKVNKKIEILSNV